MTAVYTAKPLSPIRKVIAARMAEAQRTIPHFRLTSEIEVDLLLTLREELQAKRPEDKLSVNDLLVKACAIALMDVPAVNIQWAEKEIHQYSTADIAVTVALKDGLSTPIIRAAENKSVWEISREIRALAARAAHNALKMEQVFGGSFSISNLGMYGVDQFDAIINAPQCAILAVGSAKPRVVATSKGDTRVATVLRATLSVDHRAIDGAVAAAFLAQLRQRIEQPEYLRS